MSKYDYHPDLLALVPLLPSLTDFSTAENVQEVRAQHDAMIPKMPDREDVTWEDREVPGPAGAPHCRVRIYRPRDGEGVLPGLFEIHGGGFMTGSIEMMDSWCQSMAAQLPAVVVSVDYRLAPEHPFPAGIEDCYAAFSWMVSEAEALGVDPVRIAIAGQSAGGGLAAGMALMARDRGGPTIAYQLLEIPELDDRLDTPSMMAFQDTPLWNRPNAVWSWKNYLGPDHEGDPSPYAAPARATDLADLPPAYVSTMQFDPLRDEGIRYAMRLLEAGVAVELHSYAGTFHGSAMVPEAEPSRRNAEEVLVLLRRALSAG